MTIDVSAAAVVGRPDSTLRLGTALVLGGAVAEFAVTELHPHREAPNDHSAVFAEYAHSADWISVHLGQFGAGLVLLAGILAVFAGLRPAAPDLLVRTGEAMTAVTAAVFAVLQGVDGVALKHAVDSLAAAPAALRPAAFHDAEILRWTEWAMAGYFRIAVGVTLTLLGAAVVSARAIRRWSGVLAMASGAAFVVDGIGVCTEGFAGATTANLASWALLVVFAVVASAAVWRTADHRTATDRAATTAPEHRSYMPRSASRQG